MTKRCFAGGRLAQGPMRSRWTGASLVTMSACLSVSGPAHAQVDQGTSGGNAPATRSSESGIEASVGEITVTARKREETLTRVPEAITAFSARTIEQAGLRNLRDFSNLTPNLNVTSGSGSAYPVITVRGLAQAQGGEAPIAVVIDGVQVAHPTFITQDFGDVQQVEVLRGPQGSLYGRNAIGGALNITTKEPTNELEGRVRAAYGNAETFTTNVDLSGPIVADKIRFRVGGSFNRTDGQVINLTTGKPGDSARNLFLRGRLIFDLTDKLRLDLRGNYGMDRQGVLSAEIVPNALWDDFKPGFLATDPPVQERRSLYDVSAKLDYDAGPITISSITGYSDVRDRLYGDGDFSAGHFVLQDVHLRVKAFTQELRLTSQTQGSFRWLLGAFYQDRKTDNFLDVPIDDGSGRAVPGVFAIQSQDVGKSKSWAVFGSASYEVIPKIEVTLGARYDSDRRNSKDQKFAGSSAERTFDDFQPKVQVAYRPTSNLNLFATYSRGFSSGGFNAFFSGPTSRVYKAMTADNLEAGFKGSLANNAITFGANLFQVIYNNQQFFFIVPSPPSQNIANIDETRVRGAEIEATIRPVKAFTLTAAYGILDPRIRKFAALPDSVGNRSPQTPKSTFNLTGQYVAPLTSGLDLRAYVSYRHQGAIFWDASNTLRTEPKDFVNLRVFLDRTRWSLGGFVNNLTNVQFPTQAAANAIGSGLSLRVPSGRRTYEVEGTIRF